MLKSEKLKRSLAKNTGLWMAIWILGVLNIFAVLSIGQGYSNSKIVISVIACIIGVFTINRLASSFSNNQEISADVSRQLAELMARIRPFCDGVFDKEIERITEPILGEIEQDFSKGMVWLRENNDDYMRNLEQGTAETRVVIKLADGVDSSKMKIVGKIQAKSQQLLETIAEMEHMKDNDQEEIEKYLQNKALELKTGMEKEKEIFYSYIEKLLTQQLINSNDTIDISDYFNIDKLGEQFSVVIEKSIEARLGYFKDSITKDLEYMSADIVGKMQKGALQLRNIFSDIEEYIDLLIFDYGEDVITIRRLQDSHNKITKLKEQANDFLLTLAWQDILIEKRWQDVEKKLFVVRNQVLDKVGSEVIQYTTTILNDTLPGYASLADNTETALIYKACLDAELVYQLSDSDNIRKIFNDDVYSLLQFIRPVELMVGASLRFSESGINQRRLIRDQLRQPEYLELWALVEQELQIQKPELLPYIEGLFPAGFTSFCNSPYIRQKPENVNDAAWTIFMAASAGQVLTQEGLLLIGLLLVIHKMRNKYIHPLKGLPLPLEQVEEVEYIRFCAFKSIEILLEIQLNGIVNNKLNRRSMENTR